MKNNRFVTSYAGAITVVLLFFYSNGSAQKGFYFCAGVGYGFNMVNDNHAYMHYPLDNAGVFTRYNETHITTWYGSSQNYVKTDNMELEKVGFGQGFNMAGIIGYKFNEHFSSELGISYLAGNSFATTYARTEEFLDAMNALLFGSYLSEVKELTSDPRIRLMPAVRITAIRSSLTPYLKAGMVIGVSGTITYNYDSGYRNSNGLDSTSSYELISSGGLSLGFNSALGVEYHLSESVNLFLEVSLILESWSPAHGEITKFEQNSKNKIGQLSNTTFDYSTDVSQTIVYPDSMSISMYKNKEYLAQSYPYSSWGINAGIKFTLSPGKK